MGEFLMLLWLGDVVAGLAVATFFAVPSTIILCVGAHLLCVDGSISEATRNKVVKVAVITTMMVLLFTVIAPSKQTIHTAAELSYAVQN